MSATPLHVAASLPVAGATVAAFTGAPVAADPAQPAPTETGAMPASGADDATAAATATAAEAFAARAGATDRPAIPATTTAQAGVPVTTPQSPANAGTLGGAVFALVLVVGLILLLSKLARRMPGLGGASANPALRIVGSLALGPRDRLVVVEVGDTQLLLGVGAGGTRTLHTLDQPLPAVAAKSAPAPFAQLLAQHFGKKP